jgi:hypothetical protein
MEAVTERRVSGEAGPVRSRERIDRLIADVSRVAAEWEYARWRLVAALRRRETSLRQAERRLRIARCGLDQAGWDALLAGRRPLYSARNSQAVFRAIRQRPLVEEAEAQQEEAEVSIRVGVDASWMALREVGSVILGYGALAEAITGLPKATLVRLV